MKKIILFLTLFAVTTAFAQKGRRLEILFLGDKGHHKPVERVPTIMAALGSRGVNFTYTDKLEDINPKNLAKFDALMIYANWDEITPEAEKALVDYVASGKGLLPIHCASYCFRNSPEYVKMVGGQFWRHTMDSIRTNTVQPNHPIMQGLKPFTAYDETYLHDKLQDDNNVLAVREIKPDQFKDKPNQKTEPYTWTRTHGKGKVFYTAYGHDERTWKNPDFQELIYRGIIWAVDEEAQKAHQALNPQPFAFKEAKLPNYEQRPGVQLQQLPLTPEESMKHIQVPVDFNLELFAAEPNVMHPIAMTWDEKGRLYVLITRDYPNERKETGGSDYILLCEDTNGDGKADKFTKFADGLSIPTGMVFSNGGLIVSQAPHMLFIKDTDGDDKADVKKTLFSGFGTYDTHAGPSNLHYGFDNWIWGSVGYSGFVGKVGTADTLKFGQALFRFKPDGSKVEWMTTTSNNTWGMAFNESNDVFGSTANNSHGWYMPIPHRYFNSANNIDNGSRSTDSHKDMKPITEKVRQVDVFGGFTAAAGHNFYTARAFPKKYWNKIAFVAEPTGHILHQNVMTKNGTDYNDVEGFNLMAGADEWFSPVFAETGPDGAVWVADWYSYIIQHNPTPKGFGNGPGNAYETNLRDFTRGRIYRVSWKEAPAYQPVSLSAERPAELVANLKNTNMFWRSNAQRLLVERGKTDVVPQLVEITKDKSVDEIGLNTGVIHALWTLKGLNAVTTAVLNNVIKHPSAEVRKNAVQILPETAESVQFILKNDLLNDAEPLVVLNTLLVLSKSPLTPVAEAAILSRLQKAKESSDRWLPDAFACVLTANKGKLMKGLLDGKVKKAATQPKTAAAHDHAAMNHGTAGTAATTKVAEVQPNSIDLVIKDIRFDNPNPGVRERTGFKIELANQGSVAVEKGTNVTVNIRVEGNGILEEYATREFLDGVPAGETVTLVNRKNGPWTSPMGFSTDIPGVYTFTFNVDVENFVNESNKKNNYFSKKLTFAAPSSLSDFALHRAIRSYSSANTPDQIVVLIKNAQKMTTEDRNMVYKAISEGINYRKEVKLTPQDLAYLQTLNYSGSDRLERVLRAWKVISADKVDPNVQVIKIKAVREAMKFDLKEFKVKAGAAVEIVFENPDAMQHNLVIGTQKSMEKIGLAADKMITDEKGAEKNYVPDIPEVLFSTPLVNPDQTYRLKFTAPDKVGNYPFVCTFPGHWRIMFGTMKVEK